MCIARLPNPAFSSPAKWAQLPRPVLGGKCSSPLTVFIPLLYWGLQNRAWYSWWHKFKQPQYSSWVQNLKFCRPALGFEHCLTGGKPQRKKQWELFPLLGCLNSLPQAGEAKSWVFTTECFCLSFGACDNSAEANTSVLAGNASWSLLWGFLYLVFCLYYLFPEKWTQSNLSSHWSSMWTLDQLKNESRVFI